MFNKNIISSSIIAALSSMAVSTMGYAAESEAKDVEVIEVTGIRGSLARAMDVKRSSDGIVDAISAEDIGKFPDSNLAESLQRITGVSIDRAAGEGSKVTVRGFGAANNLITLNGRQIPTTTGDRTFDFANIASESTSGVDVYKTADASVTSGGIGATINIKSFKPLQSPGTKATFGVKAVSDQSTDQGGITPEFSGLYSQTFADDTFGVSLSGSFQERDSGQQQFQQTQYWRGVDSASDAATDGRPHLADGAAGGINNPENQANDTIYSRPQQPRYEFDERQRERINGQLTLQYKPLENLTATLDYTMVRNTIEEQHTDVSVWFGDGANQTESVWSDGPNAVPLIYSEIYPADGLQDSSLTVGAWGTEDSIDSLGFNLEWEASENLSLALDYHSSQAERKATDPNRGSRNNIQLPSYTRSRAGLDLTGSLPGIATGSLENFTPQTMRLSGSWFQNLNYKSEIDQTQLSGMYHFNDEASIDFGASLNTVNNTFRSSNVQRNDWGGVGTEGGGDFADLDWNEDTVLDKFDDSANNFEGTATQGEYDLFDKIYFADFDSIVRAAELSDPEYNGVAQGGDCKAAEGAAAGPNGEGQFCASSNWDSGTNRFTEEETTALYVKFNYLGEIGDMPYDVHVGVRYEDTEVNSTARAPSYNNVIWNQGTGSTVEQAPTGTDTLAQSATYDLYLPSFNFNLEVTDDVVVRTAIGKSISRAGYNDLQGGTTINTGGSSNGYSGNSGNPGLKPLESLNFDISAEWYYDDASYLSVGYFTKKVDNWVTTGEVSSEIFGLNDPLSGPKFRAAQTALGGVGTSYDNIFLYILKNNADRAEVEPRFDSTGDVEGGVITGIAEDDTVSFNLATPVNDTRENTIDGLEFAIQHIFDESGFGIQANYTMVNADVEYDDLNLEDNVALVGLSDTSNLVGFYDKNGLQARIAYNWRDKFLDSRQLNGAYTGPVYTEAYAQIDFNVSYDLPSVEGLTVFFEGLNITEEATKQIGREDRLIHKITQNGSRYTLGARYTF